MPGQVLPAGKSASGRVQVPRIEPGHYRVAIGVTCESEIRKQAESPIFEMTF